MKLTRQGLVTAVVVVAALFVGSTLNTWLPKAQDVGEAPFRHRAAVGESVTIRTVTVQVDAFQTGKEVADSRSVAATSGIWLVLDVTVTAHGEPRKLPEAWRRIVATDGRHFGGRQALFTSCGTLQPGLATTCQFVFELPTDGLAGARLEIWAENPDEPDDVADIDLAISAEQAEVLAGETGRIVLAEPQAVSGP